ncbi:MAG: response regulator, partial [Cyanobacteria bacterium J06649_11]
MKDEKIDINNSEILIVDDTLNNLRLLSMILTVKGYEVRKAVNGKMALESINTSPPDLILLDIKMPEMDGYETCRRLKENPLTEGIPVIFISALDDVVDKVKAFSVGGIDYITKPFQQEEVLARIQNQLRIKFLNQELAERNRELKNLNSKLEYSNQQLHDFTHMVSHDLQQPLQSIIGFSNLILLQHKDTIGKSVSRYLERINQAGDRMQVFIQDLLSLANLGEGEQAIYAVDCNVVLGHVIDNLQGEIQHKDALIQHDSLPVVMGNDVQLLQLFQNLISNALKYAHPERCPIIQITVNVKGDAYLFEIQDNGIGISSEFTHRIFEPFQKAHQGEY